MSVLFHKNQNTFGLKKTLERKKPLELEYFGVNYTDTCLESLAKHQAMFFKIYLCVYPEDSYVFLKVIHKSMTLSEMISNLNTNLPFS